METKPSYGGSLVILDSRALDRECLAKALIDRGLNMDVCAVGSIEEWKHEKDLYPPVQAVLFNIGSRKTDDSTLASEISKVMAEFRSPPIIVLSDSDDLAQVVKMLEYGARGFIPSCVGIAVCVEAIGLAVAGGVFVPASSVLSVRHLMSTPTASEPRLLSGMFTLRQEAVVEALRKGKANKIIAYELNLRESTVKVHIRNIMKKLKATNRTEVAYKLNDMFPIN
ncbi:response regulator transcription factor [Rhizobium terrae]|uniref:response regulator transcription factor n=1 Tax=Rhizobium terrae TaxID=2171756 RepID=UPI001D00AF6D|nr:response regulator transcription factor [Rhizobium terrae]